MTLVEKEIIENCEEEPSLIFNLIKDSKTNLVDIIISTNPKIINTCDNAGNDVMTRLLKVKEYDLVLKYLNKRSWDVNHQNLDGNTFGHYLVQDNSISSLKILEKLTKKKNYISNIKNNKGQTAFDKSISNNYSYVTFKFLGNKNFDNISEESFINLYNTYIHNNYYGKYSKINNLEIIVNNLKKRNLCPTIEEIINKILENIETIKNDIINGKGIFLDNIIKSII